MSNPTPNPEEHDPASISEALRRDARRIGEAPFDMALQRETMARIREMSEAGRSRFGFRFVPALAIGSAVAVAVLLLSFLFKPSRHPEGASVVDLAPLRQAAPRASVWSYEMALARSDADLSAALDRDAQALLPVTPKLPDGSL